MTPPTDNTDVLIGFGLFVVSEAIGMSPLRQSSLLQVIVHMARELFPYSLERVERPTRENRPRLRWPRRGR